MRSVGSASNSLGKLAELMISTAVGAILMSLSTVTVAINARLLKIEN